MTIDYKAFNQAYRAFMDRQGKLAINDNQTFRFECPSDCWGTCCGAAKVLEHRPINIVLGPVDVYRLAQGLRMPMADVVREYCHVGYMAEGAGWPVVQYGNPAEGRPCAFLTDDRRCGIRQYRPEACRSAPIVEVRVPDDNGNMHGVQQLVKPHMDCVGIGRGPEWTPITWRQDQDVQWQQGWYGDLGFWAMPRLVEMKKDEQDWWAILLLNLLFSVDTYLPADIQAQPTRMWRRSAEAVRTAVRMRGRPYEEIERQATAVLVYGTKFRSRK